jgi:two-component system, chemotaxis family, response regulator WspF
VRIALVNDSSLALEALRRVLALEPRHRIVWEARDGEQAVQKAARDRPDLILMDLLMPGLDGVEATRRIMAATPCPILVVTGSVNSRAGLVYQALGHGALDAIRMPSLVEPAAEAGAPLLRRIRQIGRLTQPSPPQSASPTGRAPGAVRHVLPPLIAIGSSTGGPAALAACLGALPQELGGAVLIAQHIEAQFAPGLAQWLDGQIALPVQTVREGDPLRAGMVHLAATNDHLVLRADGRLGYTPEPRQEPYRPSVNQLFQSLLQPWVKPGQAVLLTGMGRDGATGLLALRQAGWHTYAQTQATCAVYGMPRAAVELQAACEQLDPASIGASLRRHQQQGRAARQP